MTTSCRAVARMASVGVSGGVRGAAGRLASSRKVRKSRMCERIVPVPAMPAMPAEPMEFMELAVLAVPVGRLARPVSSSSQVIQSRWFSRHTLYTRLL